MKIPFVSFERTNSLIRSEIVESFEAFFDGGWYILGERVKSFEAAYAAFSQVGHCIGVSNGLDALHICLKVLGIGPGDEVIIPSNTYIATALAVSQVGATPIFAEPNPATYNIEASGIEPHINARTRAIIPVHLYGQACDMTGIMAMANRHGLKVVEDNAQAQAATFKGQPTGSFGHINATSFYPGKNLGALGDAGAITTNDASLANIAMKLRNYGSAQKYHNEVIGFNMRLDECQAAFLSIKLAHLEAWTAQRRAIAKRYDEGLKEIEGLILPVMAAGATHVFHLYVVRTPQRDELQRHLTERGIGTLIHYPIPPHLQQAYANLNIPGGSLPIAEELASTCLSLPVWPGMSHEEVDFVCEEIRAFFHR
jgi:dTDP-4-amino-4,6-dideoxygalactose transaminase